MDLAVSPPRARTGCECEPLHNPVDYAQAGAATSRLLWNLGRGLGIVDAGCGSSRVTIGKQFAKRWLASPY